MFEFRKTVKSIKICIIKRAYAAYNSLLEKKGKNRSKLIIFSKAFRLPENKNLKDELKVISNAENLSRTNESNNKQKRKQKSIFRAFDTKTIKSNKTGMFDEQYQYEKTKTSDENESGSKDKGNTETIKNLTFKGKSKFIYQAFARKLSFLLINILGV